MNVLFVAEDCPYPPDNGGRLRTFNLLKHLSLRHEITLVSPAYPGADLDAAFGHRLKRVITVSPQRPTTLRTLRSFVSPLPYIVRKFQNPAMSAAVRETLAAHPFDLLHCDSAMVAPSVPVNAPTPKVLNMHSIEAVVWERYLKTERSPWMIPLLRSQLAKVTAYESQLPHIFDWCVMVSQRDREEMCIRYGCDNVSVVPNGVDLDYFRPLPDPLKPTVAFICSLDYRPNKDAVRWFVESIWPRIRAEMPETRMLLVGRRPARWVVHSCRHAGISLYADVPDTRPYLADASVIVSPIRIGGGTRLKILEAMAAARCVVSTTVGAEGLDVRDGEHLAITDDPADFAWKVVLLLRNPVRRQGLACKGRALVEGKYGWDRIAVRLEEAWNLALNANCLPHRDQTVLPRRVR